MKRAFSGILLTSLVLGSQVWLSGQAFADDDDEDHHRRHERPLSVGNWQITPTFQPNGQLENCSAMTQNASGMLVLSLTPNGQWAVGVSNPGLPVNSVVTMNQQFDNYDVIPLNVQVAGNNFAIGFMEPVNGFTAFTISKYSVWLNDVYKSWQLNNTKGAVEAIRQCVNNTPSAPQWPAAQPQQPRWPAARAPQQPQWPAAQAPQQPYYPPARQQPAGKTLTNDFTPGKCLEATGNHRVRLAPCNNTPQQRWTQFNPGVDYGFFSFRNVATDEALSPGDRWVTTCDACEGQGFYMDPWQGNPGRAHFRSHYYLNNNTETDKCLDVINDGHQDKVQMTQCGNYAGQAWKWQ